jgi:hypothetical protein
MEVGGCWVPKPQSDRFEPAIHSETSRAYCRVGSPLGANFDMIDPMQFGNGGLAG